MEVLRSLSNPGEMDDAGLLKDLKGLGKPPSFDGEDTMLNNTAVDTRETTGDVQAYRRDTRMTPYEKIRGQKYRKETLPLGEQVLARRPGARVNEHHRAIREMDNQVNQHIEMPQTQHTDKVADDSVVIQNQISPRTTETKAPEHQWDDRSGGDSRIEISTMTKDENALHIASKKETVADDTANNSYTSITSHGSQTTLSDFSKKLEEPSPTEKEEAIDDQTRSIYSH